jgi:hypothetical protein
MKKHSSLSPIIAVTMVLALPATAIQVKGNEIPRTASGSGKPDPVYFESTRGQRSVAKARQGNGCFPGRKECEERRVYMWRWRDVRGRPDRVT